MSFAKAKRENKKIEARQEKRDLEDKYKALEDTSDVPGASEYLEIDPNEGRCYRGQSFAVYGGECPQARPEALGMVIEQKYVDFLLGPGGWVGQSLAAINHAAGVNVMLDQTHKFSGYSLAKIYGSEDPRGGDKVRNAKLAIDFKLSQWLPLHDRRKGLTPGATAPATSTEDLPAMSRHGTARGSAANRRTPEPVEPNEAFEAFYRKQRVVAEAELWDEFMETMRTPMPVVESASLVPPLLLEVNIADASCSKTLECIELMRERHESQDAETGVVIANDADAERCFELLPLITRKAGPLPAAGEASGVGSMAWFSGR
eukprot:Skav205970  [mRNA]  locus=scaffold442:783872:799392:- [translate_table: standard]